LIELAHLQCVLERRPFAADPRMGDFSRDRQHREIEIGREPTVEAQLFLAIESPLLQRGEIQKAEIERLLQLVGVRAGQQYIGDVRLQVLDFIDGMRVALGLHEPAEQLAMEAV
jgi:hypothetical protein